MSIHFTAVATGRWLRGTLVRFFLQPQPLGMGWQGRMSIHFTAVSHGTLDGRDIGPFILTATATGHGLAGISSVHHLISSL